MYFYRLFAWLKISHNFPESLHSQDQKAITPSSMNLGSSFPLAGATTITGRPSTVGVAADFPIGEGLEEHLQRPPRVCGFEGAIITFQAVGQNKWFCPVARQQI